MIRKKVYEKRFLKDLKLASKRSYPINELDKIINLLVSQKPLLPKHRNHKLQGKYDGLWECHILNDWLLIYEYSDELLILIRTGTHSDLFK